MIKTSVHVAKTFLNPGVSGNRAGQDPPPLSGGVGSGSTFALLLGEDLSRNRYAVPAEADVRELTALLRQRMNERFLAVFSSYGRNGLPSSRPFTHSIEAWNRVDRLAAYGKNLPYNPAQPADSTEESAVCRNSERERRTEAGEFIERAISRASRKFGVDENLVRAVIKAESNFRPDSTSPKGAMGLMQLMPGTAREMGVSDPYNPGENIMGGVRYLRLLLDRYDGSVDKALAAYNWGMGNLERGGGRLPGETRTYIARVQGYYEDFRRDV